MVLALKVMVNPPVDVPAETVTVPRVVPFSVMVTVAPPAGAFPVSVTVPVTVSPGWAVLGLKLREATPTVPPAP